MDWRRTGPLRHRVGGGPASQPGTRSGSGPRGRCGPGAVGAPLLTPSVIAQLERCRCIVRLGVGYDSVDVAAATAHRIPVCNVPAYCTDDVADHTIALLMDSLRHLARQDRWIRAGRWDRRAARPTRLLQG
ncbi:MAG: hypothetical protein HC875_25225, partial [Anaerolineales bacterium]|nr:hypothetical protein [Anaerolineales bacterium]